MFVHANTLQDGNALQDGARVCYRKSFDQAKMKDRAEEVTGAYTDPSRPPPRPPPGGMGGGMGGGGMGGGGGYAFGGGGGGGGGPPPGEPPPPPPMPPPPKPPPPWGGLGGGRDGSVYAPVTSSARSLFLAWSHDLR